jgi:hypothetical protein
MLRIFVEPTASGDYPMRRPLSFVAERVGFEPTEGLPLRQFSRLEP